LELGRIRRSGIALSVGRSAIHGQVEEIVPMRLMLQCGRPHVVKIRKRLILLTGIVLRKGVLRLERGMRIILLRFHQSGMIFQQKFLRRKNRLVGASAALGLMVSSLLMELWLMTQRVT